MYFVKPTTNFVCSRGDTFILPIYINIGTQLEPKKLVFSDNDILYIGIRECNQSFEDSVIRCRLDKSDLEKSDYKLILESKQTENLLPGKYIIEMKLRQYENENEIITTVLEGTNFNIIGSSKNPFSSDFNSDDEDYEWETL